MTVCSAFTRRKVLLGSAALAAAPALASSVAPTAHAETAALNPQPLPPSRDWARALPNGPDMRSKMTEEYAKLVARDAYFWAWPLMNIYNKRLGFKDTPEPMLVGPGPAAPVSLFARDATDITPGSDFHHC